MSLAERPVAQVTRVITQARARADVRDLAAWVVSALRDLPATEEPLEPERPLSALPIYQHPGLTDEQRDRWIYRFRAVTTPAEQRAILVRLAQEHPQ
jgi:lipase chaperone LimK